MNRIEKFQRQIECFDIAASNRTREFFVPRPDGDIADQIASALTISREHQVIVAPIGFGKSTELLQAEARLKQQLPASELTAYWDPASVPHGIDLLATGWLVAVCAAVVAQAALDRASLVPDRAVDLAKTLLQFRPDRARDTLPSTTEPAEKILADLLSTLGTRATVLLDSVDRVGQFALLADVLEHDLITLSRAGVNVVMTLPFEFSYEVISEQAMSHFALPHLLFAAPDDPKAQQWLQSLLRVRNREQFFHEESIVRIAEASGGVPRFAISIARGALQMAFHNSADEVTPEHVRWSTEKFFASQFARGLEPYELDALATLALTGKINGEFSWRKMINKGAAIATDKQLRGLRAHPLLIEYFRREAA